jgi:hypothetical protein
MEHVVEEEGLSSSSWNVHGSRSIRHGRLRTLNLARLGSNDDQPSILLARARPHGGFMIVVISIFLRFASS